MSARAGQRLRSSWFLSHRFSIVATEARPGRPHCGAGTAGARKHRQHVEGKDVAQQILSFDLVDPKDLTDHPQNWREHPSNQQAALREVFYQNDSGSASWT